MVIELTCDSLFTLRPVIESDLPIFFDHQRDPIAYHLADFRSREEAAFYTHWHKIMSDESNLIRTLLVDDKVAGHVVSFMMNGEREVGYWLGREFWGKGIATKALRIFLDLLLERPVYGVTAKHNVGSQKALTNCGFTLVGEVEGMLRFELK
jgi:RimJ/RimL family protein N-acetyltransferase